MNRVKIDDLGVGQPLPWHVYDSRGLLLLRRGFVISSRSQLERLVHEGVYAMKAAAGRVAAESNQAAIPDSPFKRFGDFQARLRKLYEELRSGVANGLPERIRKLCSDIQMLCAKDQDAVLGAVHLLDEGHYTVVHSLHVAILAEVFLRALGISGADRISILAATLTKDVGMMEVQETLHRQQTSPTSEQWQIIRGHPRRSREMLETAGVSDPVWLDSVLHHHERLDGAGYPDGLKEEDVLFPVRLLAIVDIYCAMIKRRARRDLLTPKDVLREIFLQQVGAVDEHLAKLFIKELGVFPPGVYVRLHNGETAVVTHRRKDAKWPWVYSIIGPRGAPLLKPVKRDPCQKDFEIFEMVPRDAGVKIVPCALWGYAAS